MLEIAINNVEVGSEKHRVDSVSFCEYRSGKVFFQKSAFIMISIISLNSSHSGGNFDILNFSVHQNSKKLIYFFKNE